LLAGGTSSGCREFVFLHGMQQPMKHLEVEGAILLRFEFQGSATDLVFRS
jgi:hypothetical protein